MNYIKQINAFWERERELEGLDAFLQSYYFTCLYFANKYGFSFEVYRDDIMEGAKLSKGSYYRVRDLASDLGLVTYREGKSKRTKCRFEVVQLYRIQDTTKDTTQDTYPQKEAEPSQIRDTTRDTTRDHTNKLVNITNTNNTTATTKEPEAVLYSPSGNDVRLPYSSKEFQKTWRIWLLYLEENTFPLPTKTQERIVLGDLQRYAGKDEALALNIIKYSIKGGWKKICYPAADEVAKLTPVKPKQEAPRMLTRSEGYDTRSLFGTLREDAA